MVTFCIVENGVVTNIAVGTGENQDKPLADNWIECSANIGDLYDGKKFTPAPIFDPSPEPYSLDKIAAALIKGGLATEDELKGK